MSTCVLNEGWAIGCRDAAGGVQRVLIQNYDPAQSYTYDTNGQILTGVLTATANVTFYEFHQRMEQASFVQKGNHSVANGTNFWEQTLTMVFQKYQYKLRDLVYMLALTELTVLIEDQNGTWILMGEQNGVNLTDSSGDFGKAYGDMNGSTVTFTGKEPKMATLATPAYIATLTIV